MPNVPWRTAIRSCLVAVLWVPGVAWTPAVGRGDETTTLREELVRKWDLNGDGSIDDGEAEIARSKMRRERDEVERKSGLDPLTGEPRSNGADDESAPHSAAPPLPPAKPKSDRSQPGLPGTRVPDVTAPIPAAIPAAAEPDARPAERARREDKDPRASGGADRRQGPQGPGRAAGAGSGRMRTERGPEIVTGGARAGAPARPGYGSVGPRLDLNAGRLPAGAPGGRPAPASGGLLPSPRRTQGPPAAAPRPRRTVDDFNVY